jgi:hypothetical protein
MFIYCRPLLFSLLLVSVSVHNFLFGFEQYTTPNFQYSPLFKTKTVQEKPLCKNFCGNEWYEKGLNQGRMA